MGMVPSFWSDEVELNGGKTDRYIFPEFVASCTFFKLLHAFCWDLKHQGINLKLLIEKRVFRRKKDA